MADTKLNLQIDVKGASKASGEIDKVEGKLSKMANISGKAKVALVGVATAGIGLIGKLGQLAGEFEQTEVAFTTMLGSGEEAQALLKDITDFAASTPFELPGIQSAAKSLLAFGTESEEIIPTLRRLGDVGAGLNIPLGELSEIYGKAQTSGRLFAEDINQLSGRGIPIIKELAKQFGVAESEVKGLVESGAVGFENLEEAFVSMTDEGGQFAGLMEAQSETLLGQWSNLKDALTQLGITLGQALLPVLKPMVETIAAMANRIKQFTQENPRVAKLAGIMLLVVSAISAILVPITALASILPLLATGWATVSASILPIAGIITALIAVVVLLKKAWESNFLGIQDKTKNFVEAMKFWFELFSYIVETIFTAIKDFIQAVMESEFIEYIRSALERLSQIWDSAWEAIGSFFENIWNRIKNTVATVWSIINNIIIGGMAVLNGDWQLAWEKVQEVVETIWEAIVDKITGYVDTVMDIIDTFVGSIKSAIDWLKKLIRKDEEANSGIGGAVEGARAIGGGVMKGNTYLVGERGPELFTPQSSGSIVPNHQMGSASNVVINISGVINEEAAESVSEMIIKDLKLSSVIG